MSSPNQTTNSFITTAAALATVAVISLPLLQSDTASRLLLSSKKLQVKRVKEYLHRWTRVLLKSILTIRQGHDQQMDKTITEVFFQENDMKAFIKNTLMNEKEENYNNITIMSIEPYDDDMEYYVFLRNTSNNEIYQLPFVKFGVLLSDAMEEQLTTTAMCFVADASSGLGGSVLSTLLQESKAGVAVVQEPLWMAIFAQLLEQNLFSRDQMERILFGLCRLDAWRVRSDVGSARTVVFVLPGQACTPALLPLLQTVFPCERHLFCYDGCVNSVKRALWWRKNSDGSSSLDEFHNTISATTPMSRVSLTASIRNLSDSLAKLPITLADTTEAWMTSVDAFLKMKEEEALNDYLPYVLKLSLLFNDDESLDNPTSPKRLALTNVLQFITGSRSRPLKEAVLDAAIESLRDYTCNLPTLPSISAKHTASIEDCVFQHKSILIENKTLIDTVVPQKEWTLKAAKKISGCACCAPEEGDEEEESNVAKKERSRPKYVDGKMGFAFDPTQFG